MKECIQYGEAFKLQIVQELEEGKHGSCHAVAQAYGIGGPLPGQRSTDFSR